MFPSFFQVVLKKIFWSRHSAKVLVQILSDLNSKGGACLGPMSGPFYPRSLLPIFYSITCIFTFPGTKPKFCGLSSQRLMLFQTCFLCLRDFHCIAFLVPSPKRTGFFSPSSHSYIISLSAILCSLPQALLQGAVIGTK